MRNPTYNTLLAKLASLDAGLMGSRLESVSLSAGELLFEAGGQVDHVYFPGSAVVEETLLLAGGEPYRLRRVDHSGVVGLGALAEPLSRWSARVIVRGDAFRLPYGDFQRLLHESADVSQAVLYEVGLWILAQA